MKVKNIIFIVVFFIVGMVFGSCSGTIASASQDNPIKIWYQNQNGCYNTLVVVDDNTGVNYVVVATEMGGGHRSIAIAPRYNADGTLYLKK